MEQQIDSLKDALKKMEAEKSGEIANAKKSLEAKISDLLNQLNEAEKAFKRVRSFLDDDSVELNLSPILNKISLPPSNYAC